MKTDDSYLARRRFLCGTLGGGAAALGATLVGPLAAYVANARSEPLPEFAVYSQADVELKPGESKFVRYGSLPVLLLRTPSEPSSFRVFAATCTHLDCIVGYQPDLGCIRCACHEGRFDLEGRVLSGPPSGALRTLYHAWRGGQLVLALEEKNLAQAP